MRRQEHGARNGDSDFCSQRVIEKLLVRAPPKRVIDHRSSGEGGILQKRAIERYVLRNAIDDHVVPARLSLNHFVDFDRFSDDPLPPGLIIDTIDEGPGKRVFLAK